jgi:hypothetical protein
VFVWWKSCILKKVDTYQEELLMGRVAAWC